jgi:hypothetical protein
MAYRIAISYEAGLHISLANVPDGTYIILIEGLPEGVFFNELAEVLNGVLLLELFGITADMEGTHILTLTLLDEDGNVVATAGMFALTIGDPAPVPPVPEQPVPLPVQETNLLRFVIGSPQYAANGMPRSIIDNVAPFIDPVYDRTMMPLRAVAESLGATVTWVEETRTVIIVRAGVTITLPVDAPLPGGMGMPAIVDGRTFVPLAYVAEQLGANVRWDGDARAVYVLL